LKAINTPDPDLPSDEEETDEIIRRFCRLAKQKKPIDWTEEEEAPFKEEAKRRNDISEGKAKPANSHDMFWAKTKIKKMIDQLITAASKDYYYDIFLSIILILKHF
jgi:hypothetical protein